MRIGLICVICLNVNYIPSGCSHYAFRFLACADAKSKENMFDDKLRNEDTTWRHSKDKDDRVAADLSSTPQGSKELKIKRFTSMTQWRVHSKGEFVNTLPK